LPECYLCRRISNEFRTHDHCRKKNSLDHVFIAWEYNRLSADLLKRFKYKSVLDIKKCLVDIFHLSLQNSSYKKHLKNTLLIPVPISFKRLNDRGFNQTEVVAKELSKRMNIDINTELIKRHGSDHQALKDKMERLSNSKNPFSINKRFDLSKYKSITILDDVITTGKTLNNISKVIKDEYGEDIEVNAICMFRGKPYYSETDV